MSNQTKASSEKSYGEVLFDAVREQLRQKLTEVEYDAGRIRRLFLSLNGESDRACSIVSFCFIDDELLSLMKKAMSSDISGGFASIFGGTAPLATASARIKISKSLDWIDAATYKNLEMLRKIRNEFAHTLECNAASDPKIQSLIASMGPVDDCIIEAALPNGSFARLSSREKLEVHSLITCVHMIVGLICAPTAQKFGLPSRIGTSWRWELMPEPLKGVWETIDVLKNILQHPEN